MCALKGDVVKRIVALCLVLACAAPLAAWSQDAKPSSSHREATEELLRIMGVEETSKSAAQSFFDAMTQQNPGMEDYRDVLMKWATDTLSWEKMGPRMTDLYMRTFTESEIRELTAFYKTPIGQKTLQKLPALMQEGMQIGMELAQEHQGELEAAIKARQKELSDMLEPGAKNADEEADSKPPSPHV
jgi:hypothetical protein